MAYEMDKDELMDLERLLAIVRHALWETEEEEIVARELIAQIDWRRKAIKTKATIDMFTHEMIKELENKK